MKLFLMYLIRCDRIIILLGIVFLLYGIVADLAKDMCKLEEGSMSKKENFNITLSHCNLVVTAYQSANGYEYWKYESRNYMNSLVLTGENYTEGIGAAGQYYCRCFISIKIDFTKEFAN